VQAPSGERWIFHRNADGSIDSGMQLTNDGATEGDGVGGTIVGNQGGYTRAQTKAGFYATLDDTAQTAEIQTPGGRTITASDAAGTITVESATGHKVLLDDNSGTTGVTVETAGGLVAHLNDVGWVPS
jgi:hypothetical protein